MKKLLPILVVPFIVMICFFMVMISNSVLSSMGAIHYSSVEGFAVSSDGTVFIGYMQVIEAYKDGSLIFTFKPPTSRGYSFYIENDKIVIGTASGHCKIYDTKGNYVEDGDISFNEVTSRAKKKKAYTTENGDVYEFHGFLEMKPFEIRRNQETIIKGSVLDYHFYGLPYVILFVLTFISGIFFVFALVEQFYYKH